MNIEEVRDYCLGKAGVTEHFPFDEVTLVFKVGGKMFVLIPTDEPELSITVKCDPEGAMDLRERFPSITGAFHMNKTHWNTIRRGPGITEALLREWIDLSYTLVFESLPRKKRQELAPDPDREAG